MPKTLIESNPQEIRPLLIEERDKSLSIAEFFCDTIQGEGVTTGVPSAFLRLQGCTLDCVWCDTASVWKTGNPYTFEQIFALMDEAGLPYRLSQGQHLILTGGSPLKQQQNLSHFLHQFQVRYKFLPYIECENECVLMPSHSMITFVDQWNNSPKLANSGMKERARYKPEVIKTMAAFENSWFKFVVEKEDDWNEIDRDFLATGFIKREQIVIMPCGENQELLSVTRPIAAEIAIKQGVRFCDRLHVTIWDKKTGV